MQLAYNNKNMLQAGLIIAGMQQDSNSNAHTAPAGCVGAHAAAASHS